ncbi:MAG: isopentenyl-diphosphate delta-isomerase [Chloroflexi bacterium]|nr:MAG: isopentenyl-diphosphate delta-isomerase [Chloroflexota bacterium]MBA4374782.1 type 2 isopentenyl-diphosphate Delta-isomerase [Anaerolinea sp.]
MDDFGYKTHNRKQDHIRINLKEDVNSLLSTVFDHYYFENNALPELDLQKIELGCSFLGHSLKAPLLISSMTGGTVEGLKININLARAAEERGIAFGLGSQRAGLESEKVAKSFNLRRWAPHIPIYANLGAIQLNNGYGLDDCKRIIEMASANALILHLNPLQEALQPEGQTNFAGLAKKIEMICKQLGVPVIAKEVGWGISEKVAKTLVNLGVSCIDVAGAGGTSWSQVEKFRNDAEERIRISSHFQDWGIPTGEAIQLVCRAVPEISVIASGGLRKGLDLAKSLALGASIGGIAGGFLKAATQSSEAVTSLIDELLLELRIGMFAAGVGDIDQLHKTPIYKRS